MTRRQAGKTIFIAAGNASSLINFRGPLIAAMRRSGARVIVAAPGLRESPPVRAALEDLGVSLHEIPLRRTRVDPVADAFLLARLARLLRRESPEILFAYTAKAVIFGILAAAIARIPRRYALITGLGYAFTGDSRGKRRLMRSALELLYRLALRHAHKVFFQNPDDAALFARLGLIPKDLPVVIANGSGVDLRRFPLTSLPEGPTQFLLVARLLSSKGIREYAAAAALVRERHPDACFHMVGGADSNPDALGIDEVRKWHSDGILLWHGEVCDVRPYIEACHVYVLPSYREGTPRSVLEAMAMGRAIVTTDVPGCRETVIDSHNGFLVPPASVEPLARAMERFVESPGLCAEMGLRSRALAERKFDVEKVNSHMLREMELS